MIKAKEEFLQHTEDRQVLCAEIKLGDDYYGDCVHKFTLKVGYPASDFDKFLNQLDFEYSDGYGSQQLFGTIWYKGGTWSERVEYDGSEWWEYRGCPVIPDYLKEVNK